MATTEDFIRYVCDQIAGAGAVRYRKMFGEYMVYVDDRPVLLVCDNTVFVKKLPCTAEVLPDTGIPYEGAKEHCILDIDNQALSLAVARQLAEVTPLPKKKKPSKKG